MDPDVNELEALAALVESDGWALFVRYADKVHGAEACVQQIDTTLATVNRGDLEAATDTVTQIRAAARAVQRVLRYPAERVKALQAAKGKPATFLGRRRA